MKSLNRKLLAHNHFSGSWRLDQIRSGRRSLVVSPSPKKEASLSDFRQRKQMIPCSQKWWLLMMWPDELLPMWMAIWPSNQEVPEREPGCLQGNYNPKSAWISESAMELNKFWDPVLNETFLIGSITSSEKKRQVQVRLGNNCKFSHDYWNKSLFAPPQNLSLEVIPSA